MACVTLKRPLDALSHPLPSSPHSRCPPTKRRRCGAGGFTPSKREQSRDRFEASSPLPSSSSPFPLGPSPGSSPFSSSTSLSPAQIANNLRDELRRLRKRRQLAAPYDRSNNNGGGRAASSSPEPMMDDAAAVRAATTALASGGQYAAAATGKDLDKPIFTLRQVTQVCERICKDREDEIRDEFQGILQQKLSEQYESFVKFIDQQIQQRFNESQLPSYLS